MNRRFFPTLLLVALVAAPALGNAQDASAAAALGTGGAPAANVPAVPPRPETIRSMEPSPVREPDVAAPRSASSAPRSGAEPEPKDAGREPTDFQLFVATSVGKLLPIFGQELFGSAPSTYAPVVDAPASPEYVVGPGDEILVRGWGQVDIDVRAVVTREGTINIPRVGVLAVGGTRYGDLQGRIKAAVARNFRNFDLSVSLGRLRSIQIFVVGHALRPGLYTVSSLSTLMNALFASGGPSSTGSMRRIQLRRADALVGEFDLYDVLLNGDKSRDQRLLSGDVIFIPPVGPVAAIAGPVKTPAVFELRPRAKLSELIEYAGGLTTTAARQSILLERLEQRRGRVVQDLPWTEAALEAPLQDGDVVQLRRTTTRFENAVTLRGSVVTPFRTAWREGLTVADLIPDRSALVSPGYWTRAAARAFASAPRSMPRRQADGAQQEAQERVRTDVENLVDEVNWDYAVVERLDRERLEPRLIPFNLGRAVLDRDPASNPMLQPGDIVTVFSRSDILTPTEKRTYFVRVEGEVKVPGVYQVKPGETLRELVAKAGGLTANAYLFGTEFNRESVRREQQARLDEIAARADKELDRSAAERLARALNAEDTATVRAQIEGQRAALARVKALRATGRMVLELRPEARSADELPVVALEDGDRLFVPGLYSAVGVFGAVYNPSNFLYAPGRTLDFYLEQAGGPTRYADADSTFVLRADGSVVSRRQAGWFSRFGSRRLMPNDNIVVPEEFAPTSWVKELKDWSQIFYQFGLGVAALKVLRG